MGRSFYDSLCYMAKIDKVKDIKFIKGNWGQVKGGKKGRR